MPFLFVGMLVFEFFSVILRLRRNLHPSQVMTVNEAISFLKSSLNGTTDNGEINAIVRMVIKHVLNYEPVDIILRGDHDVPEFVESRLAHIASRLNRKEPIQYVLGTAHFHGHDFTVTPATLIPRPETEQLVDIIIDENPREDLSVLDVGTGSGCIAISLAMALKFASVIAIDISNDALAVAQKNAATIKARVTFKQADALQPWPIDPESLDIVVSNPPYICNSERGEMEPNVLDYEPSQALFVSDDDPLKFYRSIATQSTITLKPGGRLYFEINRRFGHETAAMLQQLGYDNISIINDTFGNQRFVSATWKS